MSILPKSFLSLVPFFYAVANLCRCVLRFAHRSRPSSFGKVQREEDANALQETICVSSVFCWGMHPARWDLWMHCTARAEFMVLGHTRPGCKLTLGCLMCSHEHCSVGCWHSVVSSDQRRCCHTFTTGKKCAVWWMCPFFVTIKDSVLNIVLPGRSSHMSCIMGA